jgi:CHAT domain-containing protein
VEIETLMSIPMTSTVTNRNSYLDKNFNRSQFITSLTQGSSIVHIATHFRSKGNIARLSQLLLGDGSVISLEDIRSDIPKLETNLITLSACDTGDLIPSSKGQIFEGLANSFHVNGANNVISTLWSISDEATAKFMGIFYTLLLNNEISASEALFHSQNIFRHGTINVLPKYITFKQLQNSHLLVNLNQYSHPYYWAAFRLSSIN